MEDEDVPMEEAGEPSTPVRSGKRPRPDDEEDFRVGSIMRFDLKDFMTYKDMSFCPGPRLNLLVGPNGTGKSSIVCAIALGTAGSPNLLGRAGQVGDYVRRGAEWGSVKLTLRGKEEGSAISVYRKIYKNNNSQWQLNGKNCRQEDVKRVVKELNLQVGNLCQFLPQDKVSEFAKMDPIRLLEETEKAADNGLYELHQDLDKASKDVKGLDTTVEQHQRQLERLRGEQKSLQPDVERMQEREKKLEEANLMSMKRPWLEFDKAKVDMAQAKQAFQESKATKQEKEAEIKHLKAPLEKKKAEKAAATAASKKAQDTARKLEAKRTELGDVSQDLENRVDAKEKEIEGVKRAEQQRLEKLDKAQQELEAVEKELEELPPYQPKTEELQALKAPYMEVEARVREKHGEISEAEESKRGDMQKLAWLDQQIKQMEDAKSRRLQALSRNGNSRIFDLVRRLNELRPQLKGPVYGPVLQEVTVDNRLHAQFLEKQCPKYVWTAIVCSDQDDKTLLDIELKPFFGTVIRRDLNAPSYVRTKFAVSEQMKQAGVLGTLDQLFTCPDLVKEALCDAAMLQKSYFGNERAEDSAQQVVEHFGIQDIWLPNTHLRTTRSKYADARSTNASSLRPLKLFSEGVNTNELAGLKQQQQELFASVQQKEAQVVELKREQAELERAVAELNRQRETLVRKNQEEKKRRTDLERKIDMRRKKVASYAQPADVERAEAKLRADIAALNDARFTKALALRDTFRALVDAQMQYSGLVLDAAKLEEDVNRLQEEFDEQNQAVVALEEELRRNKAQYEKAKNTLKEKLAYAHSVCEPGIHNEAWEKFPDTIEALDEAIEDLKLEAERIICDNPNVLREFQERARSIADLEEKLEDELSGQAGKHDKIEELKAQWLPQLRKVVARINDTFSHNFAEMAVAGEVALDEKGLEFDKYGIMIKVKFREGEPLAVLSTQHHSGGERSVSTILYLISMQDLSKCPFRVVDEINQGMDPNNERKMFQQLVRSASLPDTPQCFLLTPKLLPDLDYSPECTILNIMNGPWLGDTAKKWKPDESLLANVGKA
ncbi:Structural maintenance of chromosome protein SMC5/Spr18 [Klebsormidium nitens]|uniref:Structural maintenance of chromosomes protein 5 n=1 Tax=Klebsormidium nitens TaxID=105231 RepID=A0A1Y1HVC6_KLENI|nr:Structural maintenance of chromosome protein SMC5/Spr18 [Klebsormidium nitens]|eukprot:GAQ80931.1 Structural maintenance of chromosome protein SMC5/Spr18 [Klebsormidium nitens]